MKTVVITGAAGGIGSALCEVFAKGGYRVVGIDRVAAAGVAICADVADPAQMNTLPLRVTQLGAGGVAVLINNAAVQILGSTHAVTAEAWQETIQVNVFAALRLTQLFLPTLESVINIGSVHARLTKPEFVAYATSKAALAGLTNALAVDLGGRVRVNCIEPAATSTQMLEAGFAANRPARAHLDQCHPRGSIATPEEVARTALFLASDAARAVTGAILRVDGGISGRLHDPL